MERRLKSAQWRGLEVGNVVRVVRDEFFPCDIVMLDSSNDEHTCYVETKNLDGETNLKTKRSVEVDGVTFDRRLVQVVLGTVVHRANTRTTRSTRIQATWESEHR